MSAEGSAVIGRERPRWRLWALLAAACVAATVLPLLVGLLADVYALVFWGVLSAYVGLSWIVPGVLVGLAVSDLARRRNVAVAAGIATGALLLIGWAGLLAAFGADSLNETSGTGADRPSAAPAALVRAHAGEARTVEAVHCEQIVEGTFFCAVTFTGPACQLWEVSDGEATDIGPVIASATGSRSADGARCGGNR